MKQIVVTGAAGFIGSNLARKLNKYGYDNLILVDKFGDFTKAKNLEGIRATQKIEREQFIPWLSSNSAQVEFIFHLGARTDTTEFDRSIFDTLNVNYSKAIWEICAAKEIPLVYASSAATYGIGENGFSDEHDIIPKLKPLNPYGDSKQAFDLFALKQKQMPPFWAGLKFFNVYGPFEFHKSRMASVAFHAYHQIKQTGKMKLFKSHRPEYKDGEQLRDFIFVEDIVEVCIHFYKNRKQSGIYNVGTGEARTFKDLAQAIFAAMHLPSQIEYIPIPEDIRDKYQYFTEAKMEKLRSAGFTSSFTPLEKGIEGYVSFLKAR